MEDYEELSVRYQIKVISHHDENVKGSTIPSTCKKKKKNNCGPRETGKNSGQVFLNTRFWLVSHYILQSLFSVYHTIVMY